MVIDDVKILLDIDDTLQDNILTLYIRKVVTLIANYLNTTVDISATYPDAVVEYVIIMYNKRGNEGLKQFKFENTDVTYIDEGVPKSVKDLLPNPYVKMLGVD